MKKSPKKQVSISDDALALKKGQQVVIVSNPDLNRFGQIALDRKQIPLKQNYIHQIFVLMEFVCTRESIDKNIINYFGYSRNFFIEYEAKHGHIPVYTLNIIEDNRGNPSEIEILFFPKNKFEKHKVKEILHEHT